MFWTGCEVADLKQRQKLTAMDHGNKIQSLVLPTDDPGDASGCMCEYCPCACEYGDIYPTAPIAQKYGVSLHPTMDFKYFFEKVRNLPAPNERDCQTAWGFDRWDPSGRQRRACPHGADSPHFHMHRGKIGQFLSEVWVSPAAHAGLCVDGP